jgi:hypothetical protein
VLYHATNAISASNTIESGANAIYEAGNSITLLGGFKTENGSIFETSTHMAPEVLSPYPYTLFFENDSAFHMPFSANNGIGGYELISKNEIKIISYYAVTRAGMTPFDILLMSEFKTMKSYCVKDKILTFKGNNTEIKFKQREDRLPMIF